MAAVVLLSGGLDSTVAAAHAAAHGGLALALTVDYNQQAGEREIEASASVAARLGAEHRVVRVPFLGEVSGSALTAASHELPEPDHRSLDDPECARERAGSVWVPNRNGLFLNIAACFAQALALESVVVGFNREEADSFPDNRPGFVKACNEAFSFTLGEPVRIESPTLHLDKKAIVKMGIELGAPLDLVWSCYGAGPEHCLRCDSCLRTKRAFDSLDAWERHGPRSTI